MPSTDCIPDSLDGKEYNPARSVVAIISGGLVGRSTLGGAELRSGVGTATAGTVGDAWRI